MTIFGDGLQTRAFTYIDDVAPLIARCVDVPGSANQIFNVGAEVATSVRELAHVVAAAFGVKPEIRSSRPARRWSTPFRAATR